MNKSFALVLAFRSKIRASRLALDDGGFPHLSYHDRSNDDLRYARWDGTQWVLETVDSGRQVGAFSSLALDRNGYPHISYQYVSQAQVKYAWWDGSQWHFDAVSNWMWPGIYTSLALDRDDHPHVTYYSMYNTNPPQNHLKYREWDGSG